MGRTRRSKHQEMAEDSRGNYGGRFAGAGDSLGFYGGKFAGKIWRENVTHSSSDTLSSVTFGNVR